MYNLYLLIVLIRLERYPSLIFLLWKKAFQTEVRPAIERSDRSAFVRKLYGSSTWNKHRKQEKVLLIGRDSRAAEYVKIHGDKNCKHFVPDLRPKSIVYKNSWQGSISAMTIYWVVKPFYDIAVRPFCKKPPLFRSRSIGCSKTINQNARLA